MLDAAAVDVDEKVVAEATAAVAGMEPAEERLAAKVEAADGALFWVLPVEARKEEAAGAGDAAAAGAGDPLLCALLTDR